MKKVSNENLKIPTILSWGVSWLSTTTTTSNITSTFWWRNHSLCKRIIMILKPPFRRSPKIKIKSRCPWTTKLWAYWIKFQTTLVISTKLSTSKTVRNNQSNHWSNQVPLLSKKIILLKRLKNEFKSGIRIVKVMKTLRTMILKTLLRL